MAKKKENTITKITWQYTEILPEETMEFLRGIAADYGKGLLKMCFFVLPGHGLVTH